MKTPAGFTTVFFFMWLFFSSDLWIIIISEEAPPKKRGRYIFLVTFLAAFGAVTIPIVRDIVVTTNPSSWRKMTYWAYLAIPLAFMGLGMKETAAFRNQRQFKRESFNFKEKLKTFIKPFSAGHRKVLIAFIVIGFLTGMGFAVNTTQEVFITDVISNFITDEQTRLETVTDVIFIITIGPLLFQILSGILVDVVGRKPLFMMYMVLNALSSCMFGLFALNSSYMNFLSIKIWGFIWIGSFWTVFLMSKAYCVECFPTEFRSTASGWRSFSYALGLTIGALIASGLSTFLSLGALFAVSSTAISVIGIPLTIFLLPETKGKDLSIVQ